MNSKSKENILKAYEQLINIYKGHMKVVRMISSDHEQTLKSCEEKLEKKEKPLKIPFSSIQKITEEDLPKPKRKFKKMVPTLLNKPPANTERLSPKPMDNIPSPSSAFYSNLKIEEEVVKEDERRKVSD
jgi:hypothetical protein